MAQADENKNSKIYKYLKQRADGLKGTLMLSFNKWRSLANKIDVVIK